MIFTSQLSLDGMQVGRAAVTNGKRRHGVPDAATIPIQQVLRIRELHGPIRAQNQMSDR